MLRTQTVVRKSLQVFHMLSGVLSSLLLISLKSSFEKVFDSFFHFFFWVWAVADTSFKFLLFIYFDLKQKMYIFILMKI